MSSFPSICADALVDVHFIDASSAVLTRVAFTVVYILVAVCASESFLTLAGKLADPLAPAGPVWAAHV